MNDFIMQGTHLWFECMQSANNREVSSLLRDEVDEHNKAIAKISVSIEYYFIDDEKSPRSAALRSSPF